MLRAAGGLERGPDVGAGRNTRQDALLKRQPPGGANSVLIAYGDNLIHDLQVEVLGYEAGPGALNLVRSRFEGLLPGLGNHRRVLGFHGNGLEGLPAGLDHFAHPGKGAAGADCRNEDVGLAVGIVPDFLGGGFAVDFGIGRILELLRNPGIGYLLVKLLGSPNGALHSFGPGCKHQLGAE